MLPALKLAIHLVCTPYTDRNGMSTSVLIKTVTVGGDNPSSMVLDQIPADYDDLRLVIHARVTSVGIYEQDLYIRFNSSSSNKQCKRLYANNSSSLFQARTDLLVGQVVSAVSGTPSFSSTNVYITDYASSNYKAYSSESSQNAINNYGSGSWENIVTGLWSDTSAITSITIEPSGGTFIEGTTASLYGVSKFVSAATSAKATGGTITFDAASDSWIHTFTSSGTFTPLEDLTEVDYLVVGGGGAGGYYVGGGGGGGGFRTTISPSGGGTTGEAKLSLTGSTAYTVSVGAAGNESVFHTITSAAGGHGGGSGNGGSGGGGRGYPSGYATAGTGISGQGYNGGNAYYSSQSESYCAGGGGGGAGGGGSSANSGAYGGYGGAGAPALITGSITYYAGGGGGSVGYQKATATGGIGGGGNGGERSGAAPVSGTANTGGGGGGGIGPNYNGAAGGSGIVIVRYKA